MTHPKRHVFRRALMVLLLMTASLPAFVNPVAAVTTLSIQPSVLAADVGSQFTFHVVVTDAPNLCGYDFGLFYDTQSLTAVEVTLDEFVFSEKSFLVVKQDVFEDLGEIRYVVTLLGVEPDPVVSGALLTVTMRVDVLRPSLLDLRDDVLVSCVGGTTSEIPHETMKAVIPELSPATLRNVGCRAEIPGFNINAHGTMQTVFCRLENSGSEVVVLRADFAYVSVGGASGLVSSPDVTLQPGQLAVLSAQITVAVAFDVFIVDGTIIRIVTTPDGTVLNIPGDSDIFKFNVRVCTSGECL